MAVLVNLWSKQSGEIKRFLEKYYEKEIKMDNEVEQWVYIYSRPLDSIDIISALMDNFDKYKIFLFIQIDKGEIHPLTLENYNDVIKGIICLYYKEISEVTY